jgi:hypothetical protein
VAETGFGVFEIDKKTGLDAFIRFVDKHAALHEERLKPFQHEIDHRFEQRMKESRQALVASFEMLQQNEAGGGRLKKETHLRGGHRLPPSLALRHPWLPDLPSPSPTCPLGEGARDRCLNHPVGQLTTQRPSKSA